ncbi:unnamed protein product [Effrenium voratum]|uniref:Uncharacterized protein n=1 Tax=Effrenium voratum TaxID=2562239 RepID=A0AA36JT90_9DINO|nr:unnamed protein product [Effrenium voratum]
MVQNFLLSFNWICQNVPVKVPAGRRQLNPYLDSSSTIASESLLLRFPAAFCGVNSAGFGTHVHAITWNSR